MSKTLQNRGIFTACSTAAWLCSFSDTVVDNVAAVSLSIYLFISVGVTEKVGNKFTKDGAVGVGMGLVRCWALSCCIFHRAIGHSSDWAVPLAVFGVVAQAPRSPRHLPGPG